MSGFKKMSFKQGVTWVLIFTLVSIVIDVLLNLDKLFTRGFFLSESFLLSILKLVLISCVLILVFNWNQIHRKLFKTKS